MGILVWRVEKIKFIFTKGRLAMKEVKIFVEDNGYREYEDTDDLLKTITKEYDEPRKVILQLQDIEGQVITGRCTCVIGTLENGDFLLIGNIDDVAFEKK